MVFLRFNGVYGANFGGSFHGFLRFAMVPLTFHRRQLWFIWASWAPPSKIAFAGSMQF